MSSLQEEPQSSATRLQFLFKLMERLPESIGNTTVRLFPWPVKLKTVLNPPDTTGGLDWSLEVESLPMDESETNYDSRKRTWPENILNTTMLKQQFVEVDGTLSTSAPFTADSLSDFVGSAVAYNLVPIDEVVVPAYQVFPSPNPSGTPQPGPAVISLNTHQWYLVAGFCSRDLDKNPPLDGTYVGTDLGVLILAYDSDAALSMRTKFDQVQQELANE